MQLLLLISPGHKSFMKHQNGIFTISLDFELYWGVRDKKNIDDYGENILGVRSAIPAILKLFDEYKIHATWACVGFLFLNDLDELLRELPDQKPNYINKKLSPYDYITSELSARAKIDLYHYALSLIKLILSHQNQEIGSHTFSHYYCLERGQSIDTFKADLVAACKIAKKKYNINIKSLVFPRNQTQIEYLSVLKEKGILSYRGNELAWLYSARNEEDESLPRRALRLIDAYLNLSGSNCYSLDEIVSEPPFNIRSSRFLRPYSKQLRILEPLRLQRIMSGLSYAARKGLVYHLWWHPHNFGANLNQNIAFLAKILDHYNYLKETYGMGSPGFAVIS
jgi:hypothetical protein